MASSADGRFVLRGGRIVDGTGAPACEGDVAIADGRIVGVGQVDAPGFTAIDVGGLVVAPGFIDPHTHYDAQIIWDPLASCSSWHGVTTIVMGNCGFGIAPCRPRDREALLRMLVRVEGMSYDALARGVAWEFETFPQYLDMLDRRGLQVNVGAFFGHSPLRQYVMGEAAWERAATEPELATMERMVAEATAAGAIGFSSSTQPSHVGEKGSPVPSRLASEDELIRLARAMGRGLVMMSRETSVEPKALDLLRRIAEAARVPVTFGSIRQDPSADGKHRRALDAVATLAASGIALVPQVSSVSLSFEFNLSRPFIFYRFPVWQRVLAAPAAEHLAMFRQPAFRDEFRQALTHSGRGYLFAAGGWPLRVKSVASERLRPRVGKAVTELGGDPVDAFFDLALDDGLATEFEGVLMNTDEQAVGEILRDPHTLLALSDAGAHSSLLCEAGQTSYFLGHWVRDRKLMSLEEGVRRITSRPAELFGLTDRGTVAAGKQADLVVFDPAAIGARDPELVRDLPDGGPRFVQRADGIVWSFVNGQPLIEAGRLPEPGRRRPSGSVLRPSRGARP